ncbi:MAG: hypothetical protein AAB914_02705 [Patescibacteria group bacterium]
MKDNQKTSQILDHVLKFVITTSALGSAVLAPNIVVAIDKPLQKYYKNFDKRQREREAKRIIYYMKSQGYLVGEYEHGITITHKGKLRQATNNFGNLKIGTVHKWDKKWRIVMYDIPEKQGSGRRALTGKLRSLGFFQLQKSAWIHPLPCPEIVEEICSAYGVNKYVSYIEASHIDNDIVLIKRFQKLLPKTKF